MNIGKFFVKTLKNLLKQFQSTVKLFDMDFTVVFVHKLHITLFKDD